MSLTLAVAAKAAVPTTVAALTATDVGALMSKAVLVDASEDVRPAGLVVGGAKAHADEDSKKKETRLRFIVLVKNILSTEKDNLDDEG